MAGWDGQATRRRIGCDREISQALTDKPPDVNRTIGGGRAPARGFDGKRDVYKPGGRTARIRILLAARRLALVLYFVSAGAAGGGLKNVVSIRSFQTSPSRTGMLDQ